MGELVKAAAACAVAAVLAAALKKDVPALALFLSLAAACAVMFAALGLLGEAADFFRELAERAGMAPAALGVVLKTLGIAILTRLAADLCKESGSVAAASAVELLGSAASLFAALPLMRTVFRMIEGLL